MIAEARRIVPLEFEHQEPGSAVDRAIEPVAPASQNRNREDPLGIVRFDQPLRRVPNGLQRQFGQNGVQRIPPRNRFQTEEFGSICGVVGDVMVRRDDQHRAE